MPSPSRRKPVEKHGGKESVSSKDDPIKKLRAENRRLRAELKRTRAGNPSVSGAALDSAERKRAETVLAESEKRFRALVENCQDQISLLDRHGTLLWESPSTSNILGYETGKFISQDIFQLMHPDDLEWNRKLFVQLIQNPGWQQFGSFRLRHGDGSWRWMEAMATNLLNEPGIEAVVLNYRDVTERKLAEEALNRRAEELAALQGTVLEISSPRSLPELLNLIVERAANLLGASSGGLYLTEPQHRRVRCAVSYKTKSDFTGTLLDYGVGAAGYVAETGQPLIIDDYSKWTGRADVYEKEQPFQAVMSAPMLWQGRVSGVIHLLRDDISKKFTPAELTLLSLFANHAAVAVENTRLYNSLEQELVERRQVEQDLQQSEARYRNLIEQAWDGIFIADGGGTLVFTNQRADEMLGYAKGELIGVPISATYPEEQRQLAAERITKVQAGMHLQFERSMLRKDASTFPVEVTIGKLPNGMTQGVVRDITERKQAEEKLRASEARNRAIIDAVPDLLFEIDRDGIILDYSAPDESALYAPPEAFLGKSTNEVLPQHIARVAMEKIEEALKTKKMARFEYDLTMPAGLRFYESRIVALTENSVLAVVRDITDRKRAEDELRESEERYHSIFNGVQDAIFVESKDGRIIAVNERACEMFGYTREEFTARNIADIVPDERNILKTPSVTPVESINRRANGELFPVEVSGRAQTIDNEDVLLFIVRDITKRKQAEEKLRKSEDRYRDLVENSQDLICTHDLEGRILSANPWAAKVLGYELDTVLQMNIRDFLAPEVRGGMEAYFAKIREHGAAKGLLLVQTAAGERRIWEYNNTLRTEVAIPVVRGMAHDITERKRAEDELRESEAKYRSLAENIESGVATVDAQGTFHYMNSVAAAALGAGPEALIGKNMRELFPAEMADAQLAVVRQVIESGEGSVNESKSIVADGAHWYRTSVQPIRDASGSVKLALVNVIDITRRRENEEKIRAALEEKESLLREVHHRVKNNLQAMIALMDMRSQHIQDETARQFLKELEGQARTMALVYEQLYQSENLARVDMSSYIAQLTSNILEAFGKNRDLELKLNASAILDVAEAMPCGLIVNELFTNSLKYAFPPGFKDRPIVTIDLHQEGQTCHLTVSDNGVGLPPDLDVRSSRTLGLHLVHLWATHQLGGTLEIAGRPGAAFSVTFATQTTRES